MDIKDYKCKNCANWVKYRRKIDFNLIGIELRYCDETNKLTNAIYSCEVPTLFIAKKDADNEI
jgi:hypothetical protein